MCIESANDEPATKYTGEYEHKIERKKEIKTEFVRKL